MSLGKGELSLSQLLNLTLGRMIPALTVPLLFLCATSASPAAGRGDPKSKLIPSTTKGTHAIAKPTPSQAALRHLMVPADNFGLEMLTDHQRTRATHPQRQGQDLALPDKTRAKTKVTLDNNTGPRKVNSLSNREALAGAQPEGRNFIPSFFGNSKVHQDRSQLSSYFQLHTKSSSLTASQNLQGRKYSRNNDYGSMDHESNRPGKMNPHREEEVVSNSTKPAWVINRQPSSVLFQRPAFRKGFDNKEMCIAECHRDKDEREAYCNSDFAVNGIVQDMESVGKESRLLTLLVSSDGLYKMNRLYISPDGFFFKVKILVTDTLNCHKPCLDFKPGVRYIIMGQIYHKRIIFPQAMQHLLGGRLRAGDGFIKSSSYVQRFNRKRGRKVLAAAHSKCR
ncbi:UPF0450 protein C17orf58 homolog isoform X2 [Xenopus laevis]|uniref:UPF0450 protein C17orf58 homolog isoform X2 n=1 Tax=Xenopus laevis TaxID=8355 RepID=A0A8J0TQ75_XENLA|nr:UPF0450 protein C17orf58 homolog isoform X2 [Xenopus laevis]